MAYSDKWPQVSAAFTANGGSNGIITIASTIGFYTKQQVTISDNAGTAVLSLEVKEVLSATTLRVGPVTALSSGGAQFTGTNLSAFLTANVATIFAAQQVKIDPGSNSVIKDVYQTEPVVALRVMTVDTLGNYVSGGGGGNVSVTILNTSLTVSEQATTAAGFQYAQVLGSSITTGNSSMTTGIPFMTLSANTVSLVVTGNLSTSVSLALGSTLAGSAQLITLPSNGSFSLDYGSNGRYVPSGNIISVYSASITVSGFLGVTAIS